MSLGYDPDASLQDADYEMAELEDAGNREAALKRRGICAHGWTQDSPDGSVKCLDCGALFPSLQAHEDARAEALGEG